MKKTSIKTKLFVVGAMLAVLPLQGCIVTKAVDVAAGTAIGVTKATLKTTGKVIGAAIPDGDDQSEE